MNVQPLKERTHSKVEMIGVKIIGDNNKKCEVPYELWCVYSGPYVTEDRACKQLLKKWENSSKRILVAGDFNNNIAPHDSNRPLKQTKILLEDMQEEGNAVILNNYRDKTTLGGTAIDLAVSIGNWNTLGFASPIPVHLSSYHFPLLVGINADERRKRTFEYTYIPKYKRDKVTSTKLANACLKVQEDMSRCDCHSLAETIINIWKDNALDTAKKAKHKGNYKHWWNDEIDQLYRQKQSYLQQHGADERFQSINEMLQQKISQAKNASFRDFASRLDHNHNTDIYWAIKNVGKRKPVTIDQLTVNQKDGTPVTDLKSKADVLSARYQVPLGFHPTRNRDRRKTLKARRNHKERQHPAGEGHTPFTTSEVAIARGELSKNKVPGLSQIKKEDFETVGSELDILVLTLANMIATTGEWPSVLKQQVVRPIPKNEQAIDEIEEDKTRPISLLEVLDKWLEKIFYNRIIQDIDYSEIQAGYVLSCDHHTSLLSEFIMGGNKKAYNIAVFTDISKAFDSVPLCELVNAIWESNIQPVYRRALSSFVEGRRFRVDLRDKDGKIASSKWRKVIYGTPQGSVLGPLLWNLFFNPLLEKIEAHRQHAEHDNLEALNLAFADDLTLIASSLNPTLAEAYLETALQIFEQFLDERNMQASPTKLKVMCLDPMRRRYSPVVHYKNVIIEVVPVHKFLGVFYDQDMSFTDQWTKVTESIANRTKVMAVLRGAHWGPTQASMIVLHQSYVESKFTYGLMSWYPFLVARLRNKIDVYLRRSIRVAIGLPVHTWNEALMLEANLDTAEGLAVKAAISLYTRINPECEEKTTLAQKHFCKRVPLWAKYLKKAPKKLWNGPVQSREKKVVLATDMIDLHSQTIETGADALKEEKKFTRLLYTDASVDLTTSPPGQAVIAYIWYQFVNNAWCETSRANAHIGSFHCSYSAEAVAITEGLRNRPCLDNLDTIGIFTDSLSNIETIRKGIARNAFERAMFESLSMLRIPTTIYHVRSHRSNDKNKEVDDLCNIHKSQQDRQSLLNWAGKRSLMLVKAWTKDWLTKFRLHNVINNVRAMQRNSMTQTYMAKFLTTRSTIPKGHKFLPRRKGVLLSKARTNRWTNCNWFLHFIKKSPSPLCSTCSVPDTTEHVLDKCCRHERERELLMESLSRQMERPTNLLISEDKVVIDKLSDFLLSVEQSRTDSPTTQ